jgi:hypothetical protein
MTTNKPTFAELRARIEEISDFHGGVMPRDDALSWAGYVAALLEWSLIDAEDHGRSQELLGAESAGPTLAIFLGPEGAKEAAQREAVPARSYAVGGI